VPRKPVDFEWLGYTAQQIRILNGLDRLGDHDWVSDLRNQEAMPRMMRMLQATGLTITSTREAMRAIGYGKNALLQLDRWESERTIEQTRK
jgi:hypothetical protein